MFSGALNVAVKPVVVGVRLVATRSVEATVLWLPKLMPLAVWLACSVDEVGLIVRRGREA